MSLPRNEAWFAARRRGNGWSLPIRWQGWLVMAVYAAGMVAAALGLVRAHPLAYVLFVVAWTALWFAMLAWKGEPTQWRWSPIDDDHGRA